MTDATIDAAHIEHQRAWSRETFGPAEIRGPLGPLAHIRKELEEVAAEPTDLEEWVDVLILAIDGAWRAGHEPQAIIDAVKAKQAKNEARSWPDWRAFSADEAIEHVRDVPLCPACRHQPHGSLGFCPNLASDSDCSCTYGSTDEAAR